MVRLALKNLFRDRTRLLVALCGVTCSSVLMLVLYGILIAFGLRASLCVDRINADIWVASRKSTSFDLSLPIPERAFNAVRGVPGVRRADKLIAAYAVLRTPTGRMENVQVLGYNTVSCMGGPWKMVRGRSKDVASGDFMIIDESSRAKLGDPEVGDSRELSGHKLKTVGFSGDSACLPTWSRVFTSYDTARKVVGDWLGPGDTVFVLAKLEPWADAEDVKVVLQKRLRHLDVCTQDEYSMRTRMYWMFGTGFGITLSIVAILGFFVGFTITSQTLYMAVTEHLDDYAVLLAMGAKSSELYTVVLTQAAFIAFVGFLLSWPFTLLVRQGVRAAQMDMSLPPYLCLSVIAVILAMCGLAALVPVRKLLSIDPVSVFKS